MHSAAEWKAINKAAKHPLFAAFVFLSILNVECDELHIFYLGISQYFIGSICKIIVYRFFRGTLDERVSALWSRIMLKYDELGTEHQFTAMSSTTFLHPTKPVDTQPKIKGQGSEIKGVVEPLMAVWNDLKDTSTHDGKVSEALLSLSKIQKILTDHKFDAFLPMDVSVNFVQHTDDCLEAYSWLGVAADRRNEFLFTGAPKLHWAWHLADRSRFLNPRVVATFSGEHFVQNMKRIAAKCASASPLHAIPIKVMEKNRWGQFLDDKQCTH